MPKLSEVSRLKVSPDVLVTYEQIVVYWAKLLIKMRKFGRVQIPLMVFDVKHVLSNEVTYLNALLSFEAGDFVACHATLRSLFKEDPVHHDGMVLYASIYFHDKDLVSQTESEALVVNAT